MKSSCRLFVVVALFAVSAACWSGLGSSPAQEKGAPGGGVAPTVPVPKWEYKVTTLSVENDKAEKELNKLGEDGWELVGTPSDLAGARTGGAITLKVQMVLKRPKK